MRAGEENSIRAGETRVDIPNEKNKAREKDADCSESEKG